MVSSSTAATISPELTMMGSMAGSGCKRSTIVITAAEASAVSTHGHQRMPVFTETPAMPAQSESSTGC